jgi:hypothetical protein
MLWDRWGFALRQWSVASGPGPREERVRSLAGHRLGKPRRWGFQRNGQACISPPTQGSFQAGKYGGLASQEAFDGVR